jgi:hypothetical protein
MEDPAFQSMWKDAVQQYSESSGSKIEAKQELLLAFRSLDDLEKLLADQSEEFSKFRTKSNTPFPKVLSSILTQVTLMDKLADLGKTIVSRTFVSKMPLSSYSNILPGFSAVSSYFLCGLSTLSGSVYLKDRVKSC